MSQSPPTTLGGYQIIREIARSNDIVYEAYDPQIKRRVALKELVVPRGASEQQREDRIKRFEREARAAGSLIHPHIVTVYEVGTEGNKHFIAMEFLTGKNLRKEVDKLGTIEPKRAVEIILDILDALSFAHENGIIHRDIKPDNVQLLDDGLVKLTDFGIARLTFEPNITLDGQVFGTPSYMSPEQINGGEIDARTDVFSVGVVLYEMVAGKKPFIGDSVVSITYAIMNSQADQPAQANYALWQVIEQAIQKTPDLRFKSAGAMAEALKQVLPTFEPGAVVLDPIRPGFAPPIGQVIAGPPPVHNPFGPGQPPITAPYQPGVGPVPYQTGVGPPPAGPYSQATQAVPGYQPYNPTPLPIYYPPPPRQPLIKPETKRAIVKTLIAVILVGIVFFGIVMLLRTAQNAEVGTIFPGAETPRESTPTGLDRSTNSPISPPSGGEASIGTQPSAESSVRPPSGDTDSLDGISQLQPVVPPPDSVSPESWPDLEAAMRQGEQAILQAKQTTSLLIRRSLWTEADEAFSTAIQQANGEQANGLRDRAVNAFLNAAIDLRNAGNTSAARDALRHAKGYTSENSNLRSQIDAIIDELGG
ncbi:MAG: protein kinase [Armatimonadetes bacterium]|nr:protein kinase [Armatimonadota bacterium]